MLATERMLKRLTDNYSREGNNKKLLEASSGSEIDSIVSDLQSILNQINVDNAEDYMLAIIGANFLVFRGESTKEEFVNRIKLKLRSIRSRGTTEEIIEGLTPILNEGFELYELWDKDVSFHPAGGEDAAILLITINENANMKKEAERLKAPAVKVYLIDRRIIEDDTILIRETVYKNTIVLDDFPLDFPIRFGVETKEEI